MAAETANPWANYPLGEAAAGDNLGKVIELLDGGADIEGKDNAWGGTALFEAAHRGHVNMMKYLLSRGANPFHKSKDGSSIIDGACWGAKDPKDAAIVRQVIITLHEAQIAGMKKLVSALNTKVESL